MIKEDLDLKNNCYIIFIYYLCRKAHCGAAFGGSMKIKIRSVFTTNKKKDNKKLSPKNINFEARASTMQLIIT